MHNYIRYRMALKRPVTNGMYNVDKDDPEDVYENPNLIIHGDTNIMHPNYGVGDRYDRFLEDWKGMPFGGHTIIHENDYDPREDRDKIIYGRDTYPERALAVAFIRNTKPELTPIWDYMQDMSDKERDQFYDEYKTDAKDMEDLFAKYFRRLNDNNFWRYYTEFEPTINYLRTKHKPINILDEMLKEHILKHVK